MAQFFNAGETKIRPGVYQRYSKNQGDNAVGAINGVCAIAISADWGPLDKVTKHSTAASIIKTYGDPGSGNTVASALAMIKGGAKTVYIKRMGTGGAKASLTVGSDTNTGTITAKYEGAYPIAIAIQSKISDATKQEIIVYANGKQVEKFEYAADGTNGFANLKAATADSEYITVNGSGSVATVAAASGALTDGENPAVANSDYSAAWAEMESYDYNTIAIDVTDDTNRTKSLLLQEYLKGAHQNGKMAIAVVGEPTSVTFSERLTHAAAFNDEKVVYFGGGWIDADGETIDGAEAICYTAGVIAATPANQSIVHTVIDGAVDVVDKLTYAQYEEAILNGMLVPALGADGQVWYDSGVNTLVNPGDDQDDGWKKIRRTKTRFEILNRIDRVLAPKVGRVSCNSDGIAYIVQCGQGVLNEMMNERKIEFGATFTVDPENPYGGDSAWFVIKADDIDSLEKIYLHYQFRYTANE